MCAKNCVGKQAALRSTETMKLKSKTVEASLVQNKYFHSSSNPEKSVKSLQGHTQDNERPEMAPNALDHKDGLGTRTGWEMSVSCF